MPEIKEVEPIGSTIELDASNKKVIILNNWIE